MDKIMKPNYAELQQDWIEQGQVFRSRLVSDLTAFLTQSTNPTDKVQVDVIVNIAHRLQSVQKIITLMERTLK